MCHGRRGASSALLALALVAIVAAPAGAAAASRKATATPPAAQPGWTVPRVRFEPLTPGSIVGVDGIGDYRGAIEVGPAPNGGVAVVNDVAVEDYVRGIAEVPSSWPPEALKAQAIAARTYALHQLLSVPDSYRAIGADICATDACQVYAGLAKERQQNAAAWVAAVQATAGQAVLYQGLPILAKYSASNGGRTVAGGQPYLRAVDDPDDARYPQHQWHLLFPLDQIRSAFALPGAVTSVGRSGTAVVFGWQADDGVTGQTAVGASEFRSKLDATFPPAGGLPETVPSNLFDVSVDGGANALVLDGRGWGHGIGLSQYGALGKALRGLSASDILAAYYAGLRPVALPAAQLPAALHVALDFGRPSASVVGSAQFRVLDDKGSTIAVATSGRWQVLPATGGVRVVPPPDQRAVPHVEVVGVEGPLVPGGHPSLRYRLAATAAVVAVSVADATGLPPVGLEPSLVQPGEVVVPLPSVRAPGALTVTVTADAGGGRVTSTPVTLNVPEPAPSRISAAAASAAAVVAPARHGSRDGMVVLACCALLAAAGGTTAAGRARGRRGRVH